MKEKKIHQDYYHIRNIMSKKINDLWEEFFDIEDYEGISYELWKLESNFWAKQLLKFTSQYKPLPKQSILETK